MSKGHFGSSHFVPCGRLSSFRKLRMYKYTDGICSCREVPCREAVPEGRILKVPLFGHALLRLDYATLNDELMTILLLESLSVIR